jgi:hypothetical protein
MHEMKWDTFQVPLRFLNVHQNVRLKHELSIIAFWIDMFSFVFVEFLVVIRFKFTSRVLSMVCFLQEFGCDSKEASRLSLQARMTITRHTELWSRTTKPTHKTIPALQRPTNSIPWFQSQTWKFSTAHWKCLHKSLKVWFPHAKHLTY